MGTLLCNSFTGRETLKTGECGEGCPHVRLQQWCIEVRNMEDGRPCAGGRPLQLNIHVYVFPWCQFTAYMYTQCMFRTIPGAPTDLGGVKIITNYIQQWSVVGGDLEAELPEPQPKLLRLVLVMVCVCVHVCVCACVHACMRMRFVCLCNTLG